MQAHKKWFIHARRNASLFHLSFLIVGFNGKGWAPTIDFWIDDSIVVGFPGKGGFVYFDEKELKEKCYPSIRRSVEGNPNFVSDFRRRSDEVFGALFSACEKIEAADLPNLSDAELLDLYHAYLDTVLLCPFITVQVYGIEALIDPEYKILTTLKSALESRDRSGEFEICKEILLSNDGETVAFTERKDFYETAEKLSSDTESRDLFNKSPEEIELLLAQYPKVKDLIDTHIKKYHWVNTEYLGTSWSLQKWISLFRSAVLDSVASPAVELSHLLETAASAKARKEALIEELQFPSDVVHAIRSLGEFLAQRDWTKGYFARSLPSLHLLLEEMGRRIDVSFNQLLEHSYLEIPEYFVGKMVDKETLRKRAEEGYVLACAQGILSLSSGIEEIKKLFLREGIDDPREEVPHTNHIKGLVASRGNARGIVRVIDSASKIPEFKDGEILVTYMTTIEFIPLFRKAIAVVTDEGGMSCHAAIVSREFNLPCIVGTRVATRVLKTGDFVEIDAQSGIITKIE